MRSLLGLIMAVCLAWATPAGAGETIDGRRLNELISTYYQSPAPNAAVGWLAKVEPQALTRPEATDIVATFYLHVLRGNPALAAELADSVKAAHGPVVLTAATAIWLAGLPDRDRLLARLRSTGKLSETEVARLTGFATFDAAGFTPESAHDLDLCWASFYATGDAAYLEKVARHLPYMLPRDAMTDLSQRDDPVARQIFERALVARAAAWSLVSHAKRHERVLFAMQSIAQGEDKMNKATKALLDEVIKVPGK